MATLPEIQLDPRNEYELLEQSANHAFNVSGGLLSNFSPSDPLSFLLEGQVYAGAELLWYLNQLPAKLLAQWLAYWGLTVLPGSRATGTLTINFSSALPTAVTIAAGFRVGSGSQIFETTATVTAPISSTSIQVPIQSVEIGEANNLPPYSINQIVTPTPFVRSVFNTSPTTGGSDERTPENVIDEFVGQTYDGLISSASDLERATLSFLGAGWVTRTLLNQDPTTGLPSQGTVAVLVDNPAYETIPIGTLAGLQSHLETVCPVNFSPWCAPLQRFLVRVRLAVYVDRGVDPNIVAENCYRELLSQVDLGTWDSERISPLIYRSGGSLSSLSINEHPSITAPSNHRIHLDYLEIVTRDLDGNEGLYLYGNGDPI